MDPLFGGRMNMLVVLFFHVAVMELVGSDKAAGLKTPV